EFFAWPMQELMLGLPQDASTLEYAVQWLVSFAASSKFYSLFSFLFGLGFTVIMARAEARGAGGVRLFVRRLFILLAIGIIHGVLIWAGDILTAYAIIGFLLLAMNKLKPRTLLILSIVFLSLNLLFVTLVSGFMSLASPEGAAMMAKQAAEQKESMETAYQSAMQAYASSSWLEVTAQRWTDYSQLLIFLPFLLPSVLGMFLLGAWFGKRGFLAEPEKHLPFFRKLFIAGLVIGVPCAAYFATAGMYLDMYWPTGETWLATMANGIAAPLICLLYVSIFVLFLRNVRFLAPLASMGRMALTNYLLQSLVWSTVFYGYGLDLFGTVGMPALVLGGVVFWLLQIPFSHWWLGRYRFGPAEWVWRSLTYGKRQPMRKLPDAQVANNAA
ncbi:MAG TPA: DUF418 domain-containing protein, partial [Gammaproteobacteria bacterium]|nr:DUF418 domain-containing protein [Gammaproteobacteria bacterium]